MEDSLSDLLSIGEMAKLNEITAETLRHYERIGLIIPNYIDKETNYRYYRIEQSAKLDMILYMKNLGMPLTLIKAQLENENISFVQETLNEQLEIVEKKISELSQIKYTIEKNIENFTRFQGAPKAPDIAIEHISSRRILVYDNKIDFHSTPFSDFEYALRKFKKAIKTNHLPMTYFCNIGDIIRKESLEQNRFIISEVFILIDGTYEIDGNVEIIPECDYACTYFDDYSKKYEYTQNVMNFIHENGYQISGDFLCEVIADLPFYRKLDRKLFMKVQIPIIKKTP